ncbi:MAG: LPS export ABC transporter periplasmic protein LptC [Spirochaetes bacterium GWB1_48_6]|nr:MAG: LPS export ABC transporter periplasmic protein LptC [Spirochaetes bacterium GWB1_48_6]
MPVKPYLAILFLVLGSCSLDYGPELAESLEDTPNLVLYGLTYNSVENGQLVYTLVSETAEEFTDKKETRVTAGTFKEFDAEGQTKVEGSAGVAQINQETKDANLDKSITLYTRTEDTRLSATKLDWRNSNKFLTSPQDEKVRVERKGNSTMEGTGFSLDMRTRTLKFTGAVEGTYKNTETPKK